MRTRYLNINIIYGLLAVILSCVCLGARAEALFDVNYLKSQITQAEEALSLNQAKWTLIKNQPNEDYSAVSAKELARVSAEAKLTVARAELALESTKLRYKTVSDEIARTEQLKLQYQEKILVRSSSTEQDKALLIKIKEQIKLQTELSNVLVENMALAERILLAEKSYFKDLKAAAKAIDSKRQDREREVSIAHLRKLEKGWEEKAIQIKKELLQQKDEASKQRNLSLLLEAEEQKQILNLKIELVRNKPIINNLLTTPLNRNVDRQQQISEEVTHYVETLRKNNFLIDTKITLLQRYQEVAKDSVKQGLFTSREYRAQNKLLNNLLVDYRALKAENTRLYKELTKHEFEVKSHYAKLTIRQTLPDSVKEWRDLGLILVDMPRLVYQLFLEDVRSLSAGFWSAHSLQHILAALCILLSLSMSTFTYHRLKKNLDESFKKNTIITQQAVWFVSKVLAENVRSMVTFVVGALIILMWLVYGVLLKVILVLCCIWFVFKMMLTISRTLLLENPEDREGKDASLFYALRIAFSIAAVMTAVVIFAHQLVLPTNVSNFIDRCFMLVLLAISYPLIRNWDVLPEVLQPFIGNRPYIKKMVRLISFFFPLTIFSNAALGLIGFVNLAWQIGIIEGKLTLIFCAWLLLRGLLSDLMLFFSELCITKLNNGWLWAQALLKPLHQVVNLGLFLCAVFVSATSFGFSLDSALASQLAIWFVTPFIQSENIVISGKSLVQFFVIFAVVYWAAKWSREFSYRWVFNKIKDSSVRDSLSVFVQYSSVVLGFFVMLNALGINLTTITVLAATISIGIAFGVRDIVSNIMSGLIMLIERPVRKGDFVELTEHKGIVTNIGLRAITVKTGDNMDVILPNNEAIVKPFVNLTHDDTIIRQTFSIKTTCQKAPTEIQTIIYDSLMALPIVLESPKPTILLTEILDGVFLFEVRYFINLRKVESRWDAHSDVLLAVWQSLQDNKVELPYPSQNIYMNNEQKPS